MGSSIDMDAEKKVYSDSMSPTSPVIWSKLSRRWELNTSQAEGSARRSQQTLTMCLGLPNRLAFSSSNGSNSLPGGDQWTAQPLSPPKCFKTFRQRSEDVTTKSIIDLLPRVSRCQVH
ncbi:hypothetical protein AMECASPLE_003113 [Ameca splendens]|uniref:Uncharacterized protein n=1 Tax=Ameca splendens TaxID=208324 RepID=A0ABV1A6Y6_9TELE